MADPRIVRIAIHVEDSHKNGALFDRLWDNLFAIDATLEEVKSGVIYGVWDSEDFTIIEGVRGVKAVYRVQDQKKWNGVRTIAAPGEFASGKKRKPRT